MKKNNTLKVIFCFLLYFIVPISNSTGTYTIDKIAAIVDKDIILESDIKKIQQYYIKYNNNNYTFINTQNKKINSQKDDILHQLISDTLILQLAKKININIDDKQINEIVHHIATQNHMNYAQFQSYLTNEGINYNNYINYIRNNTIINTIREYEMHKRIRILPYELNILTERLIQNNNNAFQFDHILIPLQDNPTPTEIKQAYSLGISLTQKIKKGTDIKKLKKLYTNDNQLQNIQIQTINWSTIEELPTIFSENLIEQTLKTNTVIGPIRSNVGFHILKIKDIEYNIKKNIVTTVHIKHIILKTSNINDNQNNKNKLLKIIDRIKNKNTTFSIEAQQITQDTNNSLNQSEDLGWKYLDEFNPTIQKILKSLKKGEISAPIQNANEWSIIQLVDTKTVDKNEMLCRAHASQIIFNKKINEENNRWTQELQLSTYIKTFNNK